MTAHANTGPAATWQAVLCGDVSAYQQVVERHQSAVSAVAFSILGDFASSQDVAQETFWVAWTRRNSLRDVSRLGSWLCGIARNLARQLRRHQRRERTSREELARIRAADEGTRPVQESVAKEERELVWDALEQIPEKYREVVALYYRQGQSIAEVAAATGISQEAARQRLSRGRTMLRGRVAQLIEGVLERGAPDAAFTARVMAAIAGAAVAGKAGSAAASVVSVKSAGGAVGAVAAAAKGAGAAGGMLGGAAGSAGGLLGAWLGTWLPAQLAPTETERQLVLERGRSMMRASILFLVGVFGLVTAAVMIPIHWIYYVAALLAMMLAHTVWVILQATATMRLVRKVRERVTPETDPNQSAFGARMHARFGNWEGVSWTSRARLFGLPLVDVQMGSANERISGAARKRATGWIAMGDSARGVIALGGIATGVVAIGGVTFGLISAGGLSIGGLSLGGLAIGYLALGGGAIGWDAAGGLAIGWHSAAGGLGIAWHAAMGGGAIAHDFAVGGGAWAAEANTPLAREVVERESLQTQIMWAAENQGWMFAGILLLSLGPTAIFLLVARLVKGRSG